MSSDSRATTTHRTLLAAKRYKPPGQQFFQRSATYAKGRTVRRTRDAGALKNGSTYGRQAEAAQWSTSEWNLLAAGPRLVVIDRPQLADLTANPFGADLLARENRNAYTWFASRGLHHDPKELLAALLAATWS